MEKASKINDFRLDIIGREEGAHNKLRELAAKKYRKGMSVKEIAELLEESETTVQELLKESEMR